MKVKTFSEKYTSMFLGPKNMNFLFWKKYVFSQWWEEPHQYRGSSLWNTYKEWGHKKAIKNTDKAIIQHVRRKLLSGKGKITTFLRSDFI